MYTFTRTRIYMKTFQQTNDLWKQIDYLLNKLIKDTAATLIRYILGMHESLITEENYEKQNNLWNVGTIIETGTGIN